MNSNNKLVYIKIYDFEKYTKLEVRFTYNPDVYANMFKLGFKRSLAQNLFYRNIDNSETKRETIQSILNTLINSFGKHKVEHFKLVKTLTNLTEINNIIGE